MFGGWAKSSVELRPTGLKNADWIFQQSVNLYFDRAMFYYECSSKMCFQPNDLELPNHMASREQSSISTGSKPQKFPDYIVTVEGPSEEQAARNACVRQMKGKGERSMKERRRSSSFRAPRLKAFSDSMGKCGEEAHCNFVEMLRENWATLTKVEQLPHAVLVFKQ